MEFARLSKSHDKTHFSSGEFLVDDWLKTKARQAQEKRLSITTVIENNHQVLGYYTIAIGQISLEELPSELSKKLPRGVVPIVTLAWLGLDQSLQGKGWGDKLLLHALAHCYRTGLEFPYVAIILDCLSTKAKTFYQRFDFAELPGHPMKLFISWKTLEAIAKS